MIRYSVCQCYHMVMSVIRHMIVSVSEHSDACYGMVWYRTPRMHVNVADFDITCPTAQHISCFCYVFLYKVWPGRSTGLEMFEY